MQCEDAEVLLCEMPETSSAELTEHLKSCASCQQTATVLGLAALPEPTALERAALTQLPLKTHHAWRAKEARRFSVQRAFGYALAAGLGALVAVLAQPRVVSVVEHQPSMALAEAEWDPSDPSDDGLAADDENAFFDVSWPSLNEGEAQ